MSLNEGWTNIYLVKATLMVSRFYLIFYDVLPIKREGAGASSYGSGSDIDMMKKYEKE